MPEITKKNYDYLFQQILSIIVENNGIRAEKLIPEINSNPVFSELSNSSIVLLLKSMISNNYISSVGSSDELILGYAGERMVHNKNFYAMFETMAPYEVICDGKKIGLHDYYKKPNEFVTLAGRSWIVVSTICENRKIYVKPFDGFIGPRFEYHIGEVSELVRNEVFNILINGLIPDYINEWGIDIIKKSEKPYIKMNVSKNQRLFNSRSDVNRLELFISDKKLRSIGLYSLADDTPPM
jgi:ATP-dependent Lhr-like helicase